VEAFDLVISNMVRSGDVSAPLKICGAVYFSFPDENLRRQYGDDLTALISDCARMPRYAASQCRSASAFLDRIDRNKVLMAVRS